MGLLLVTRVQDGDFTFVIVGALLKAFALSAKSREQ